MCVWELTVSSKQHIRFMLECVSIYIGCCMCVCYVGVGVCARVLKGTLHTPNIRSTTQQTDDADTYRVPHSLCFMNRMARSPHAILS